MNNQSAPKRFGAFGSKGMIHWVLLMLAAAFLAVSALMYAASEPAQAQGKGPTQGSEEAIVHQVPKVPVKINGKSVKPAEVKDHNGKPLYTVVNPGTNLESAKDDSVQVFTTEQKAEKYTKKLADKLGEGEKDQDVSLQDTYGEVRLYDAPYYDGWEMHLGDGNAVPDFRYLYCHFWCQDYNDKASSLWLTNGRAWTMFYEHINYNGSRIWFYRGEYRADLGAYGWDNRISSMSFAPY